MHKDHRSAGGLTSTKIRMQSHLSKKSRVMGGTNIIVPTGRRGKFGTKC